MNIAFITPEYITEPESFDGGLANYLFRVTKSLNKFGHKTFVIVASKEDSYFINEGVEVYRVNIGSRIINLLIKLTRYRYSYPIRWIYQSWKLNRALNRITRKYKFDIVQYASYTATGFFRNKKIPSVVRISAYQPIWMAFYGYHPGSREVKQVEYLEKMCFRKSDGLFAPSILIAELIEKKINRKVDIIESPFIKDIIECDTVVYDKLLEGKKYLLYYGSVGPLKGVDVIAKIIKEVLWKHKDIYFAFVGKDMTYKGRKMMDYVYSMVDEERGRIIYQDKLKHQQLYPIIENAYAVVLPSKMDNLPNTCIEAMAMGKVVLGTRGASFEQLIDDSVNGFLCNPDDADSLLNSINRILFLNDIEKELIENKAQERIYELRPEVKVKDLLYYYGQVIARKNRL